MKKPISYLLLAALPGIAQAQSNHLLGDPRELDLTPVLTPLPSGLSYSKVAAGDLTGNLDEEVVYLFDGGLLVAFDLELDHTLWRIDLPAQDFVIRREDDGSRQLVLAQSGGLRIFDVSLDYRLEEAFLGPQYDVTLPHSDLHGLIDIEEIKFDPAGTKELIGLSADGLSLVLLLRDATAPGGYFTPIVSPLQTLAAAWKLVPIQLDGDPGEEIAVLTGQGLQFYDNNGAFLVEHAHAATEGDIAVVSASGVDQIAWLRPSLSGGSEVLMAEPLSLGAPKQLPEVCTSVAGGHLSPDTYDDLVLSRANESGLIYVENTGALGTPEILLSETPAMGASSADALVYDIDNDGWDDVVWASDSQRVLSVTYSDQYATYKDKKPRIEYLDFGSVDADGLVTWTTYQYGGHPAVPHDSIEIAVSLQRPDAVLGWSQPETVRRPFEVTLDDTGQSVSSVQFQLLPDDLPLDVDRAVHVDARFVRTENGVVVEKFPATRFILVRSTNVAAIQYLRTAYQDEFLKISDDDIGNGDAVGAGDHPPPPKPPVPPKP